jgi:manganese transport protein
VVMTGFIDLRVSPWLLRLGTRLLALGPAIAAIILAGSKGIYELLILSQVVLSLQLPFAIVPLIDFTSNKERMGIFANSLPLKLVAWIVAGVIMALNMKLVWDTAGSWISKESSWLWIPIIPALMVIAFVLIYIILRALRLKKVLLPKRIG